MMSFSYRAKLSKKLNKCTYRPIWSEFCADPHLGMWWVWRFYVANFSQNRSDLIFLGWVVRMYQIGSKNALNACYAILEIFCDFFSSSESFFLIKICFDDFFLFFHLIFLFFLFFLFFEFGKYNIFLKNFAFNLFNFFCFFLI